MKFTITAFASVLAMVAGTAFAQSQPSGTAAAPTRKPIPPLHSVAPAPRMPTANVGSPLMPPKKLDPKQFAEVKQGALETIDGALKRLKTDRSCVTASKDSDALLACHQASRAAMQAAMEARRAQMMSAPGVKGVPGVPNIAGAPHPTPGPGPQPALK